MSRLQQSQRDAAIADFKAGRATREQTVESLVSTGMTREAAEWMVRQAWKQGSRNA